jgi:uncharacterized protein (DUF1330 family)
MPAYLIAQIDVHDPAGFEKYRTRVTPVVEAHGGRYLVRTDSLERLEGAEPKQRLVILEFPSMDAAQSFYRSVDYAPLLRQRLASATSDIVLSEGCLPG